MTIHLDEKTHLELTVERHAEDLYLAVNNNREHLSEFLPWVENMQSVDDMRDYIKYCELLYGQNKEVTFVIISEGILIGRIGLHYLNSENNSGAIGYWLSKSTVGKGIMSKSCKAVINYGFKKLGLHRIEIKAATENFKSQAIPEKLNFIKEGILRESDLVNGKYLDLFIYSILENEWLDDTDLLITL